MSIVISNDLAWFQCGSLPTNTVTGTYNYSLVALSFLIAIVGSYVALDLIANLRAEKNNRTKIYWLIGGSFVMGTGIWSMHFVGMMALMMRVPLVYDPVCTIASLVVAIIGSGVAFYVLRTENTKNSYLILGGVILGIAIASMHYVGMEALDGTEVLDIRYFPSLFFLSIVIAILVSITAIFLALKSSQGSPLVRFQLNILGAILMGIAIFGMHYIGMAAAVFITPPAPVNPGYTLGQKDLAVFVAAAMGFIVIISLIVSTLRQLRLNELTREKELKHLHEIEKSNDLLVQKMMMVNQLAAGVAHEINNPLSYVLSNLSTLQKRFEKTARFCEENKIPLVIEDSSNLIGESQDGLIRIKDIVSNLRNFSSAADELNEPININTIIESALDMVSDKLKNKREIHKSLSRIPAIFASSKQLKTLFFNLFINAAEAIVDKGEMSIFSFATKSHIVVKIIDSGSGISPENLPKIFTPFFTTKPIGEGTGLGLSTVFGIAQLYGGSIAVESDLGKGSTFTVYFPI